MLIGNKIDPIKVMGGGPQNHFCFSWCSNKDTFGRNSLFSLINMEEPFAKIVSYFLAHLVLFFYEKMCFKAGYCIFFVDTVLHSVDLVITY